MALSGVNLPLAFTGQEYAFYRTYTEKFGLNATDLDAHFAGPAFLAWGRMGNIRGWGGQADAYPSIKGLTMNFMTQQRDLQKQIVARERSLGMHTVLGAFAGHVPMALETRFPNASVVSSGGWNGFSNRWSHVPLLEATDPLFKEIGRAFVEIQKEEYGFDADGVQYFNGDNFNEMSPPSRDPSYLAAWGDAMYAPLLDGAGTGGWACTGVTCNAYFYKTSFVCLSLSLCVSRRGLVRARLVAGALGGQRSAGVLVQSASRKIAELGSQLRHVEWIFQEVHGRHEARDGLRSARGHGRAAQHQWRPWWVGESRWVHFPLGGWVGQSRWGYSSLGGWVGG